MLKHRIKLCMVTAGLSSSLMLPAQDGNYSLGEDFNQPQTAEPINNTTASGGLFDDYPVNAPVQDTKSKIVPMQSSPIGRQKSAQTSATNVPTGGQNPSNSVLPKQQTPPMTGLPMSTSSTSQDRSSSLPLMHSPALLPGAPTSEKSAFQRPQDHSVNMVGQRNMANPQAAQTKPVDMPITAPQSAPEYHSDNVSEHLQSEPAPLVGDGSLAPVKLGHSLTTNDFGGVSPLPGTRRQMAIGEAPEFYQVEEGDTMFDVCSQLIDDGNYWPKLWSLNPDVKNPHFIYPGMKLAFYSGDPDTPPYLEVVVEDDMVPLEKGPLREVELVQEVVPTAPQPGGSEITTNSLQEGAPSAIVSAGEIGIEADVMDGFIFAGRTYASKTHSFLVPAFYYADERQSLGTVVSGANGEGLRGDASKVFVEPTDQLAPGTYTILKPRGRIISRVTGREVGYRYDFSGNVRLSKSKRSGLMEGSVFGVRNGVWAGDIVVPFVATKRYVPAQMAVGQVNVADSSIIGFDEVQKTVGGLGDLVFLEKQGLSVGTSYALYRKDVHQDMQHITHKRLLSDGLGSGVVKVLEISDEAALGIILNASAEVRVGDVLSP